MTSACTHIGAAEEGHQDGRLDVLGVHHRGDVEVDADGAVVLGHVCQQHEQQRAALAMPHKADLGEGCGKARVGTR